MTKNKILEALLFQRENTKQLLLISVMIALGTNLITTGISSLLKIEQYPIILITCGVILSIGILIFMLIIRIKKINKHVILTGFIVHNEKTKELVDVPKYRISQNMERYLSAAFIENKALENTWKREKLLDYDLTGEEIYTNSTNIFIELLEYCVIEELSNNLSSYFNDIKLSKNKIETLERKHIPDVLLENRFLKLFSEDMENREAFLDFDKEPLSDTGPITYAWNKGAVYERFELVLPKFSKIKRISKNQIAIDTRMFTFTISCGLDWRTVLENDFHIYYLGINNNYLNYVDYNFNVEINIKFKPLSFF